jgi:hypothetical protein
MPGSMLPGFSIVNILKGAREQDRTERENAKR